MRMELHILGTSSSRPANGRDVSGSIVCCDGTTILVDCGEGFQSRLLEHSAMLKANQWQKRLAHTRIDIMLFTHGHLDHTWGAMPMLQSMGMDGRNKELTIAAPIHEDAYLQLLSNGYDSVMPSSVPRVDMIHQLKMWWELLTDKIDKQDQFPINCYVVSWIDNVESWLELRPFEEDEQRVVKLSSPPTVMENVIITPYKTTHSVPSCAWRVTSKDRPGKFNRDKAGKLGLSTDEKASLARGEDIEKGGESISSSEFRGEVRSGHSLLISGDTGFDTPGFDDLINEKPLNLMVHEATFVDEQESHARQYQHSTARDAAKVAVSAKAENLVITHYSSRLTETDTSLDQARQVHDAVCCADDGDIYVIDETGEMQLFRVEDNVLNEIVKPFS